MADDRSDGNVLDSRQFVYLPGWVKFISVTILILLLICSFGASLLFLREEKASEWIVFSLSVAQSSSAALVLAFILFFSSRDANLEQLRAKSDDLIKRHIRKALELVSIPDLGINRFDVKDMGKKDIFGHLFLMSSGEFEFFLWVGLNVHKIFVIYCIGGKEDEHHIEEVKNIFKFTFGGAETVGYSCNYEPAVVRGEHVVSIWLTASTDRSLLNNPTEKLFWSQDIAMMTESFLRTAVRNSIRLEVKATPGPL